MIRICKILGLTYNSDNYYVFSAYCGEHIKLIYTGDKPPKPLKTVDYKVIGEMVNHPKFGKQMIVSEYEKVGKVNIQKPSYDYKYQ